MARFDSFRALSPTRQLIAAGVVMALLCILLTGLYWTFLRPSYDVLFANLRAPDAAAIVTELDRRKLPYQLADGGATILMPATAIDSTRLAVMSTNLPIKGMVGFELFNKSDMGLTEFAQKINYQRALQGELARTIMAIEGIESARIHLSLTQPTIFRADRTPPKASVALTTEPGAMIAPAAVRGIQRLVASSVPDLDIANVVVLDDAGDVVSGEPMASSPQTIASPLMREKEAIEAYHTAQIETALDRAGMSGLVASQVWAGINGAGGDDFSRPGSIDKRNYRLVVTLSPRIALDTARREDVQQIVAQTISLDAARGDAISFGSILEKPKEDRPAALSTPRTIQARPVPASSPEPFPTMSTLIGTVAVLVLGGLAMAIMRARNPADHHARRRQAFVERFSTLLDQEDDDAVRPA